MESGTQDNSGTVRSQEEGNAAVEHVRKFCEYLALVLEDELDNLTSCLIKRKKKDLDKEDQKSPRREALVERDEPNNRRDEGHLANQELCRRSRGGYRWRTLTMRRKSCVLISTSGGS